MGTGISYHCNKCGYQKEFYTGVGFGLPDEYQKLVSKIRSGAYGNEWKQFFETRPGAVVNADLELYQCPGCHHLEADHNLALYEHREGIPPEHGYWIKTEESRNDYTFIKNRFHKCPKCGKRMHILQDAYRPLPCPDCGGELEPGDLILWD